MADQVEAIPQVPINILKQFEDFFRLYEIKPNLTYLDKINDVHTRAGNSLIIYYEDLLIHDADLAKRLRDDPEIIADSIEAFKNLLKFYGPLAPVKYYIYIYTKDKNSLLSMPIRSIRAKHIGKLILIKGIVTRVSQLQDKITKAFFECSLCGAQFPIIQLSEMIRKPRFCTNKRCKAKAQSDFNLIEKESEFIDWQGITIQELPEELPSGRIPMSIRCILTHELVEIAKPGDRVSLVGHKSTISYRNRKNSTILNSYINVNYIEPLGKEDEFYDISQGDVKLIKENAKKKDIQNLIAHSLAPEIYGRDYLKMACALSLFSGPRKHFNDSEIREDIHVLFVGDPGTGKSLIIKGAISVAPRGLYVSGKGSSAVGLTAAVIKDADTGEMNLEAGTVVLANGGIAGIDEFDKMESKDRSALHEAMSQQTISIAKAGIVATLRAETAIIAAANPRTGRYDSYKTATQNIMMPPSLLSRFDLIFVVLDKPDAAKDAQIAEFILDKYMEAPTNSRPIQKDLLRKHIKYSKKYCDPQLTKKASERIKNFYLNLRGQYNAEDAAVSILARHLEALYRLSKSYAKMALRDKILLSDVDAIIILFTRFINDIGYDETTGKIDMDRVFVGQSRSSIKKLDKFLDILSEMFELNEGKALEKASVIQGIDAAHEEFEKTFIVDALKDLQKVGTLYEPKTGYIRFTKKPE